MELIDFCIRVLDWAGYLELLLPPSLTNPEMLRGYALAEFEDDVVDKPEKIMLPNLIDLLHAHVDAHRSSSVFFYLYHAIGITFAWLEANGLDPVALMLEKNAYNKGRTYRHGGKRC